MQTASHDARLCLSVRTQPSTDTGAPSQTSTAPCHATPCHAIVDAIVDVAARRMRLALALFGVTRLDLCGR